jgi:hypothetical protein
MNDDIRKVRAAAIDRERSLIESIDSVLAENGTQTARSGLTVDNPQEAYFRYQLRLARERQSAKGDNQGSVDYWTARLREVTA